MKLYKITYEGGGDCRIRWEGTQADTRARKKALKEEGCSDIKDEEVDVPTSKPELLAWLNENVKGE